MKTLLDKFEEKSIPEPNSGCWLWEGSLNKTGYGNLSVKEEGKYKLKKAHRVAYTLFKGVIPDGLFVLHSCDVRCCVNPDHLRLGTHQDNMDDRTIRGRGVNPPPNVQGRRIPKHKLTDEHIIEIRAKYLPRTYTLERLALEYSISYTTVRNILYKPNFRGINE